MVRAPGRLGPAALVEADDAKARLGEGQALDGAAGASADDEDFGVVGLGHRAKGNPANQLFVSPETEAHGLLWMNPATWDQMAQFMKDADQIPRAIPAQDVMTDRFIPTAALP